MFELFSTQQGHSLLLHTNVAIIFAGFIMIFTLFYTFYVLQ